MAYPVLTFDCKTYPQLGDNVWQAQMAGHPKVLTYAGPDLSIRKESRNAAMRFEHEGKRYEIPHVLSRDEYPFACTLEGGKASWVGHIEGRQNSAQGGLIAAFLRANHIVAGRGEFSKFLVSVVNHPMGPVTNPCEPRCKGCESGCKYVPHGSS